MSSVVAPHDAIEIQADHKIIRRINPKQHIVFDKNRGYNRISSKAFKPSSGPNGGMSVDLEARIRAEGHDPKIYVTTPVFTGSVFFKACDVRALALWIGYDPLPDNPSHGEVWGSPRPNRFRRDQVSGLQQTAKWYVSLQDVEIR